MFGIFNDEGCLENGFETLQSALVGLMKYLEDDHSHVAECCHDHPEQERESCEECNAEEGE